MSVLASVHGSSGSERMRPVTVVLWVRSTMERLGLLGLARAAGYDVTAYGPGPGGAGGLVAAVEAVEGALGEAVLVVALRDVDAAERRVLQRATAEGVRLLVLVDDAAEVGRVAGVRSSGFLLTAGLGPAGLTRALAGVGAGEVPIPPEVAHRLLAAVPADEPARVRLTPREQQTLILLVEGLSNKQIGTRLGVSSHGAKRLVANVLAKLDCTNRTAAVARALREGVYQRYA